MAIVIDLIIVLIFAFTLIGVVRRGFVKTVLDFASVICAVVFSKIFSPALAEVFYNFLYDKGIDKVSDVIHSLLENGNLPELFELENISLLLDKYAPGLSEKISSELIDNTVTEISRHVIGLLAYVSAFFLIFVVVIIIARIITLLIDGVFKLPLLRTLNKWLAVLLGVGVSVVYVMLFVAFMQIAIPVLSIAYPEVFSIDIIESTFVFKQLTNLEWIDFFVN